VDTFILQVLYYLVAATLLTTLLCSISILLWKQISLLWIGSAILISLLIAYAWLRVIRDLRGNKAIKQKPKAPANRLAVAPQAPQALQAPPRQPIPPTMPLVQPDQAQMQAHVAQAFAQQPLQQSQPAPIGETARLEQSLKDSAAALDDKGFEEWVAQMLTYLGWQNVQLVGGGRDRGVDIRGVFNGEKCIVQCKHYKGRLVPPNEVRALVGTLHIQKAKRGYLITSGRFGHQAFVEVHKKPVELWDLETFAAHIRNQQLD
jgi:HJR/Mrr/RecB family endonuclease